MHVVTHPAYAECHRLASHVEDPEGARRDKPTDDDPAARASPSNGDSSAPPLGVRPAASAVLSESVNVHFSGPSRSGHVKVGRDTWAWANAWAEAKRRVRGLLQFRELDKLLVR